MSKSLTNNYQIIIKNKNPTIHEKNYTMAKSDLSQAYKAVSIDLM